MALNDSDLKEWVRVCRHRASQQYRRVAAGQKTRVSGDFWKAKELEYQKILDLRKE